jgi:hypothetical protein
MLDTAKLSEIISAIKLRNGTAIGPPKKIVLTASDDAIEPTEELRHQLFSEIQLEDGPLKSPCWIFLGIQNSSGYGQLLRNGEFIAAHRVSWVIHNGPIPDGLWVLHACDQPSCCAPDQLWLGSHQENIADMVAKDRGRSSRAKVIAEANKRRTWRRI